MTRERVAGLVQAELSGPVVVPDPVPESTLPKYAGWIPEGSVQEDLPGNTYSCRVFLRRKGSSTTTLLQMRERLPDVRGTETDYHASSYLRALVPELQITSATGSSTPPRLAILGHSGHRYGLQASSGLIQWTTVGVGDAPTNRFEVADPDPAGTRRYYRVEWLANP